MPGSLSHLTRRFFDVLFSKPLDDAEIAAVEARLRPEESRLFFAQPAPDQRHGLQAAFVVIGGGDAESSAIRAALLHDIGKRHARLGVMRRSLVSMSIRLRLPLTRRGKLYRDHGQIAADELDAIGSDALVVHFARNHHGERPPAISGPTWDLLQLADEPPKARHTVKARIT